MYSSYKGANDERMGLGGRNDGRSGKKTRSRRGGAGGGGGGFGGKKRGFLKKLVLGRGDRGGENL